MAIIIKIPTWTTLNKIPVGTPADKLAALNTALGTSLVEGDMNPLWFDLQDLDLGGGPLTRGKTLTDLAEVTPIENESFLTLQHFQLAVIVGGDVYGAQVFFEITDLEEEVPAQFPNRSIITIDELGNETTTIHTWNTYYNNQWTPVDYNGKYYAPNQDVYNKGEYLPASLWIFDQNLTIKTKQEFLTIKGA